MAKVKLGQVDVEPGGDLLDADGAAILKSHTAKQQAHVDDALEVTSADATTAGVSYDQSQVQSIVTLANEIKADYNAARASINTLLAKLETLGLLKTS